MIPRPPKVTKRTVAHFRFKELAGDFLLTNDAGRYCFLKPAEFHSFLGGKTKEIPAESYSELCDKGFVLDKMDVKEMQRVYGTRNLGLCHGASLHIVVVTLRCDHKCGYCQTSSRSIAARGLDMDIKTADRVVDGIFQSPQRDLTIEFQGGEPLLNFKTVQHVVKRALSKNRRAGKNLFLSIVSNLSFLSDDKLSFLLDHKVSLCTSLDGPAFLHDRNRKSRGSSHQRLVLGIEKFRKAVRRHPSYRYHINALATISRLSLRFPVELVQEYVARGMEGVHLRPVTPFGLSGRSKEKFCFSSEEFLRFYKTAFEHILSLNRKGVLFYERTAKILLQKILTERDPCYMDLCSPCGAGRGQIAYNYNGDVYTCDEGRMLSARGDTTFRTGTVQKGTYSDWIQSEPVRVVATASCLDTLPVCSDCVYKPYCGVCPIHNYVSEGDLFSMRPQGDRCRIMTGIFDYLFEALRDSGKKEILERWVKNAPKVKEA
jgi:uncharacterized protein